MAIPLDPEQLVTEMSQSFPRFPRATIERLVRRTASEYERRPVLTFVAVLVRREVTARLKYVDALEPAWTTWRTSCTSNGNRVPTSAGR